MTTTLQQAPQVSVTPCRALKEGCIRAIDSDVGQATLQAMNPVVLTVCESPVMVSAVQSVLAAGQLAKQQLPEAIGRSLDESVEAILKHVSSEERFNETISITDDYIDGKVTEVKIKISETQQAVTDKISETKANISTTIDGAQTSLGAALIAADQSKPMNAVGDAFEPIIDAAINYVLPEQEDSGDNDCDNNETKTGAVGRVVKLIVDSPFGKVATEVLAADDAGEFALKRCLQLATKAGRHAQKRGRALAKSARSSVEKQRRSTCAQAITAMGLVSGAVIALYALWASLFSSAASFVAVQADHCVDLVAARVTPAVATVAPAVASMYAAYCVPALSALGVTEEQLVRLVAQAKSKVPSSLLAKAEELVAYASAKADAFWVDGKSNSALKRKITEMRLEDAKVESQKCEPRRLTKARAHTRPRNGSSSQHQHSD